MKKLGIPVLALFLFACSSPVKETENKTDGKEEEVSGNAEMEFYEPEAEVIIEYDLSKSLIGTWVYSNKQIGVEQVITYKKDGTYEMNMAEHKINGTWELNNNILITKSSPDAPGQKKTITNIDENNLWTIWEPKGGEAKEMKYIRK